MRKFLMEIVVPDGSDDCQTFTTTVIAEDETTAREVITDEDSSCHIISIKEIRQ